jgi:hypothetical protein
LTVREGRYSYERTVSGLKGSFCERGGQRFNIDSYYTDKQGSLLLSNCLERFESRPIQLQFVDIKISGADGRTWCSIPPSRPKNRKLSSGRSVPRTARASGIRPGSIQKRRLSCICRKKALLCLSASWHALRPRPIPLRSFTTVKNIL